jgi:hypothetical protein
MFHLIFTIKKSKLIRTYLMQYLNVKQYADLLNLFS